MSFYPKCSVCGHWHREGGPHTRDFDTPTMPGFFWAKLMSPKDVPEGEDFESVDWEVVEVFINCIDPDDDEHLRASVNGIERSQPIDAFLWGPQVKKPKELC